MTSLCTQSYTGLDEIVFKKFYNHFVCILERDPNLRLTNTVRCAISFIYQVILVELSYNSLPKFGDFIQMHIKSRELCVQLLNKLSDNLFVHLHEIFFPLLFFREYDIAARLLIQNQFDDTQRVLYPLKCYKHNKQHEEHCFCIVGEVYKNILTNPSPSLPLNSHHILNCNLCFIAYSLCYPGAVSRGQKICNIPPNCDEKYSTIIMSSRLMLRFLMKKDGLDCACLHNILTLSFYFTPILHFKDMVYIVKNLKFVTKVCCTWSFIDNYTYYLKNLRFGTSESEHILEIFRVIIKNMDQTQNSFSTLQSTQFNSCIFKLHGRFNYLSILPYYGFDLSKIIFRGRNLFCAKTLCLESEINEEGLFQDTTDLKFIFHMIRLNIDLLISQGVQINTFHDADLLTHCIVNDDTYTGLYCLSRGLIVKGYDIKDCYYHRKIMISGSFTSTFVYNNILKSQSFDDAIGKELNHFHISLMYSNWLIIYALLRMTRVKKNAKSKELLRFISSQIDFLCNSIQDRNDIPHTKLFLSNLQSLLACHLIGVESLQHLAFISLREYLTFTNFNQMLHDLRLPATFKNEMLCKDILDLCEKLGTEKLIKVEPISVRRYYNIKEM